MRLVYKPSASTLGDASYTILSIASSLEDASRQIKDFLIKIALLAFSILLPFFKSATEKALTQKF